eukprot:CAMPEP_0168605028 /NCGR_PEP_ID=MMETSP0420-20121227/15693_1 /TAXON_ID=498008 /ORGANISM="Pessonella sp." /LENGTH=140 /DNA_ID=CAMNT_0008644347 /DNA_START=157 /DNA_END=576 /DNA_ORIENTATION=+
MTLFGRGAEKASICEQLLVMGNFDLAFAVLQTFKLPVVRVYTNAINRLAHANLIGRVSDVLKDIRLMGIDDEKWDDVVMATIQTFAVELQKPEIAEKFLEKLSNAHYKARAHALCGNLKLAYIAAAKLDSTDDVHFVRNL